MVDQVPLVTIDTTYGGIYAGSSFEFSPDTAMHFNRAATEATGVQEGEYKNFEEGFHFSVACPLDGAYTVEEFLAAYHQLMVRIDGELDVRLADHARLLSADPGNVKKIRAVPTYIPKTSFPEDFFGRPHMVELFQDGRPIFGPVERFFHTTQSGTVFNHIEDGHRGIVIELRGDFFQLKKGGWFVVFTDPVFGEPAGGAQLNDDGSSIPLTYTILGRDRVGDRLLFNEGVISGIVANAERIVVKIFVPNRGQGLAAALYSGHTREAAFRTDVSVL